MIANGEWKESDRGRGHVCIQDRFVEFASASHYALDKALWPPSAFSASEAKVGAIANEDKGIKNNQNPMSHSRILSFSASGPLGSERETTVESKVLTIIPIRPIELLFCSSLSSPPHLDLWSVGYIPYLTYQTSSVHGRHCSMFHVPCPVL